MAATLGGRCTGCAHAGAGAALTTDYSGVTLNGMRAVRGGPAQNASVDLARWLRQNDPTFKSIAAFDDEMHDGLGYNRAHSEGS